MKVLEPPENEVMDYRGLAVYLKMSENTLRHKVMRGEMPYIKIGSSVRFVKKHIDVWLEGQKKGAKGGQVEGGKK